MIKTPKVLPLLAVEKWKKCMSLRHEAHVKVKKAKAPRVRSTFGSWDVEKVHAVVAWSTFPSQNVQNTPTSDHFWKLWCWKGARPCGAKHISEVKILKHWRSQAFLEIEMVKKCASSWHEAHFEVKRVQNWRSRTTFGEMVKKCTPLWR